MRARGLLMCVCSSLLFGMMAFAAKLSMRSLGGGQVAFIRFAGSALVVAALMGTLRRSLKPVRYTPLIVRGFFGGSAVLLYFVVIDKIGVGLATLLNYTSPVFTTLLSRIVLKEHLRPRTIAGLAIALVGVTLVLLGEHHLAHPAGLGWILLGILSSACSGIAVTAIRAARRTDGALEIFASFALFGVACTLPFGLPGWVMPPAWVWLALGFVVVSSVTAQLLMTSALKWVDAPTSGVLNQLSVVLAFALGVGFLGERVSILALVGSAITIAGVALAAYGPGREEAVLDVVSP